MKKWLILLAVFIVVFGVRSYIEREPKPTVLAEELTFNQNEITKMQVNDYRANHIIVAVTEEQDQIDLLFAAIEQWELQEIESLTAEKGPYVYLLYMKPVNGEGETLSIYEQGIEYKGRYYTYIEKSDLNELTEQLNLSWNEFQ